MSRISTFCRLYLAQHHHGMKALVRASHSVVCSFSLSRTDELYRPNLNISLLLYCSVTAWCKQGDSRRGKDKVCTKHFLLC